MTLYYGADSQTRTTVEVPQGTIPQAHRRPPGAGPVRFFDYIAGRLRAARPADLANVEVPSFWGRYLNEGSHQSLGPLTGAEAQDIFSMSGGRCRILPVYNGDWRREDMVTGPHARSNGRASAKQAIALASGLTPRRIPPTVRLYADLERWRVDAEWFLGWMEVMQQSAYPGIGGFYGNPLVWGSAMNNGVREYEGWSHNLVSTAEAFSDQRFGALISGLARRRGRVPASTVAKIWSNRPYLNIGGREMRPDRLFQRHFRPGLTPVSTMVETVIWQYGANIPFGLGGFASADMNVAKESAYNEMWAGN